MPKGLHAPRYKIKLQGHLFFYRQNICFIRKGNPLSGYQRLFYSQRKQNISSAMSTEIEKGETIHSHNFHEGILFQSNPLSQSRTGVQTSHISLAETYLIPEFFLPKQTRVHAPWVSVMSSESLVLIRWTDWGLMRHSLCEKAIQGWYMTIFYM